MKIGPAVRPGRRIEKKKVRTGQDSQTKKSQSGNISPIWGEAPTAPIKAKFCVVGHLADVITCAKFQVYFLGVTILQGVEFPIFLLLFAWALQQCSATALPVILHYLDM